MKNSCSVVFVIAFVLSLIVSAQTSNAVVIFQDDFQSDPATLSGSPGDFDPVIGAGDIGGTWLVDETGSDTHVQVVNDDAPWSGVAGPNNYLTLGRTTSRSNMGVVRATGWDRELTLNKIVEVNCSVYVPSTNQAWAAMGSWDDPDWEFTNRGFEIYFTPDGNIYTYDDGPVYPFPAYPILTYTPDAWVDVQIIADMSTNTFSLTIDGNTVHDVHWKQGVNAVQSFMFAPDYNNTKYCVDNLKITVVPEASTLVGLFGIAFMGIIAIFRRA